MQKFVLTDRARIMADGIVFGEKVCEPASLPLRSQIRNAGRRVRRTRRGGEEKSRGAGTKERRGDERAGRGGEERRLSSRQALTHPFVTQDFSSNRMPQGDTLLRWNSSTMLTLLLLQILLLPPPWADLRARGEGAPRRRRSKCRRGAAVCEGGGEDQSSLTPHLLALPFPSLVPARLSADGDASVNVEAVAGHVVASRIHRKEGDHSRHLLFNHSPPLLSPKLRTSEAKPRRPRGIIFLTSSMYLDEQLRTLNGEERRTGQGQQEERRGEERMRGAKRVREEARRMVSLLGVELSCHVALDESRANTVHCNSFRGGRGRGGRGRG
eukprot:768792-Hanusia_phi.AAC.10